MRRRIDSGLAGALALTSLLLSGAPALSQIEGVSYSLYPTYNTLRWNDQVGLADSDLLGGHLSLNMGSFLSVDGFYLGRDGQRTSLAGLNLLDAGSQPLVDQDVDIRNIGADIVLNLGRGEVVPFIKAGGGVMRFDTADGDRTNQINLKLGGGLKFGVDRFQVVAFVEDSAMRMDRYDLAANADTDPAFPEDPDQNKIRHNLSAGAGVEFKLGGYQGYGPTSMDQAILRRYRAGLTGVSLPIEVFGGTLDFSEDIGLRNQHLAGVRTGVDFGALVGLRGYFWQGLNDDLDATEPVISYGGEARFNLNEGSGAVPYLVLGFGQLEFGSDYTDLAGNERDDKSVLLAGGGLGLAVSDRVRVDLGVRDYMFTEENLDDLSGTDQLIHNWMLSAGVRFSLGGKSRRGVPINVVDSTPVEPADLGGPVEPVVVLEEPAAPVEETDEAAGEKAWAELEAETEQDAEAAIASAQESPASCPEPVATAIEPTNFQGERHVTIPIPAQGELYVRYGRPGGVEINSNFEGRDHPPVSVTPHVATEPASVETKPEPALDPNALREIIRQELMSHREQGAVPPTSPRTEAVETEPQGTTSLTEDERMELLERRVTDAISSQVDERFDRLESRLSQAPPQPQPDTIIIQEDRSPTTTTVTTSQRRNFKPRGSQAFLGFGVDDPGQVAFGGRLDLGPVSNGSAMHFVPELALGFGSETTSFLAAANLQYHFRSLGQKRSWTPMVGVGAGILGFSKAVDRRSKQEGVLNLSYGVSANFGRWTGFAEHQGIDLFDLNRLLLGVRWNFGR